MTVTITPYNHTTKLFANSEVSLADLKLMLLDSGASFDATDTSIDDVAGANTPPRANEVSGNGWTTGGEALGSAAVTTVTTNDAKLDATDISVAASGGSIGPADYGVIYDSDSGNVLAFIDFDGSKEAGDTTDFKVTWNASGIFTWTYT
jgi:hypothetical protein